MTREEKSIAIEDLTAKLAEANIVYIADTSGLDADTTSNLRRACFKAGIKLEVVKNTLLAKALQRANDSNLAQLIPALKGQTALILTETSNVPAKLIKEFRKGTDKPQLKAAYVEEMVFIGDDKLDALVGLKSKNELIADVIALLQSPIQRVIGGLENKTKESEEVAA